MMQLPYLSSIMRLYRAVLAAFAWIFAKMYRWLSAALVSLALGFDGIMHLLNIPHVEGWWLPLCGGGAALGGTMVWWEKRKKK